MKNNCCPSEGFNAEALKCLIRGVPDFPKPGILFYDITTLLKVPAAFQSVVAQMADPFSGQQIQKVVAVESRGFILGGPIAGRLNAGFVPVRKPGKLPSHTLEESYSLEYGTDCLTIHEDAISAGERVLIVDDLLATGGTALATHRLVTRLGGNVVGMAFMIELLFLNGRDKLPKDIVFSLLSYEQ